jgi:NADH-quinone oxidoreductase subunit C
MSELVLGRLQSKFPLHGGVLVEAGSAHGDEWARIEPASWFEVVQFLRDDPQCDMSMFIDITAVDYPKRDDRFDLVLFLYSLHKQHRVRLKTRLFEEMEEGKLDPLRPSRVKSITSLYAGANWFEREVWDMFGIRFDGHPDPRRILLYEEFIGHPLRKDYSADKTQPLVPYRETADVLGKLPPFGADEGMSFGRTDWQPRDHAWDDDDTGDKADALPPDGTAPST